MTLKRIRLELARNTEFPNGSHKHGYDFAAPLDNDGHLVADEWRKARERCRVKALLGRRSGRNRQAGAPQGWQLGLRLQPEGQTTTTSRASNSTNTASSKANTCR